MSKKLYKKQSKINNIALGLCGGFFCGLIFTGILPDVFAPLVLVTLVYLLLRPAISGRFKQYIGPICLWFTVYHAFVLSWMLKSDISEATGFTSISAKLAVSLSWLIMIAVTTSVMLLLPSAIYFVRRNWLKTDGFLLLSSLVCFWLVAEYLRSLAFGVFLHGPGGTVGDFWGFGSLGLAAVSSPIAPLASVAGLYGLSFLVIGLAVGLYQLIINRKYIFLVCMVGIIAGLGLIAKLQYLGQNPDTQQNLEVSVMSQQDNNNQADNILPIEPYRATTKDLIVLPEYSEVNIFGSSKQTDQQINARLNEQGISLDVAEARHDNNKKYAVLTAKDREGQVKQEQTKQFLIPTGEYMPYILRGLFSAIGQTNIVEDYDTNQAIHKGQVPEVISAGQVKVGAIACSGILNRQAYRQLTRQGAEVLASNASLVIFNGSKSYFDQSLTMAKFHAVANHRPFIQATKAAPSFVLDANGRYILQPDSVTDRFSDVQVVTSSKTTLFTRFGELGLYLAATFSLVMIGFTLVRLRTARGR